MTKLFSHTSYTMQTNHHYHHTYESPKQYYSTQLSHTFFNGNIVLPCTKFITATTLKNSSRASYVIGQAHIRIFSFCAKYTHWATPATCNFVVAACGASFLVSRQPCMFHWGGCERALSFLLFLLETCGHGLENSDPWIRVCGGHRTDTKCGKSKTCTFNWNESLMWGSGRGRLRWWINVVCKWK
jgi:hypothetical protein